MDKKVINKMTSDEIFRQQLELLAEKSKNEDITIDELVSLTKAMTDLAALYYLP